METPSVEETKKRYQALPPEVKGLLYSPDMSFAVQQIGKKNKLHIDQIDALNTEIGQVMLGFTPVDQFVSELMRMMDLDQERANAVAQDVNDMLFAKIRESMKKVDEIARTQTPPAASSASVSPHAARPATSSGTTASKSPTPPAPPQPAPQATAGTAGAPQNTAPLAPKLQPALPHSADLMLTQKTASVAPPASSAPSSGLAPKPATPSAEKPQTPKPGNYKTDPYREPPE